MKNLLIFFLTLCTVQVAFSQTISKAEAERKAKAGEPIHIYSDNGLNINWDGADLSKAILLVTARGSIQLDLKNCNLTEARISVTSIEYEVEMKFTACTFKDSYLLSINGSYSGSRLEFHQVKDIEQTSISLPCLDGENWIILKDCSFKGLENHLGFTGSALEVEKTNTTGDYTEYSGKTEIK